MQSSDWVLGKIIFALSHEPDVGDGRGARYINYRDLSVQHLGSVYERILEFGLRAGSDGSLEVDADEDARHSSGSYYTPEELVSLVITKAVGPLVDEKVAFFAKQSAALKSDHRAVTERLADLERHDPASTILSLKVCDPAMGSGHFLVSLVDWLSDEVLRSMVEATAVVDWGAYTSPLANRLVEIRGRIRSEADTHAWPIADAQLDDRHIVRRMALKRVVYGVDKNPMAVELAKVALWLHSFTVGAPLSFLDHHLRTGDSVVGAWVRPTMDSLQSRGALFNLGQITHVEQVAGLMAEIEDTTDNDITEVTSSKSKFGKVEDVTAPVAALFSLLTAERLSGIFEAAPARRPDITKLKGAGKTDRQLTKARADLLAFERAAAFQLVLEGTFGDPVRIATGRAQVASPELKQKLALLPPDEPDQASLFPNISVDDRRRMTADSIVEEGRAIAADHGFFHWEIGFPNVWTNLGSTESSGGFDAIIGNPPYVRQEILGADLKRALKASYVAFDGMADLYVYFYEQGLRLLKPGGRMSFVVTNKWLKAGYAEELRGLFMDKGWLVFIADFGHAKHFFPDADVFPSVLVMRRPVNTDEAPQDSDVCVIPRDSVPRKGLSIAVQEATFRLPRAMFTKEAWVLEPKPVMDLLDKIKRNGVPLSEYARVKPLYGIKTGFNEAFLIDSAKRDQLIRDDSKCAAIIKPYLRGQDIERWVSSWNGLWMIFARRGIQIDQYPSVHRYLEFYRTQLEPKPVNWEPATSEEKWLGRKEGNYLWYEVQDPVDYWEQFRAPKILIKRIEFYADFSLDESDNHVNDSALILPSTDRWILAVANSPASWAFRFRRFPHKKDEALAMDIPYVEALPVPTPSEMHRNQATDIVDRLIILKKSNQQACSAIQDWLQHEFGTVKKINILAHPFDMVADTFIRAVRKALPKNRRLSVADIQRLKEEHCETIEPTRSAAAESLSLERRLADLVNEAYGLTPEEVALMWETAPPRMPFTPA